MSANSGHLLPTGWPWHAFSRAFFTNCRRPDTSRRPTPVGGNKVVGAQFFPEKPVDKAGEQVADCLNRSRPQKFDPEQVIWILHEARKKDCHAGMYYIAQECDYESTPITREQQKDEALAKVEIISSQLAEAMAILQRLSA